MGIYQLRHIIMNLPRHIDSLSSITTTDWHATTTNRSTLLIARCLDRINPVTSSGWQIESARIVGALTMESCSVVITPYKSLIPAKKNQFFPLIMTLTLILWAQSMSLPPTFPCLLHFLRSLLYVFSFTPPPPSPVLFLASYYSFTHLILSSLWGWGNLGMMWSTESQLNQARNIWGNNALRECSTC